jgi:hypothetical protein
VKWREAQFRAREVIKQRFSKKDKYKLLIKRLKTVARELEHHRTNNFTGAMLMHHTMVSTKYMSRWIEEKNRRS